MPHVLTPWGALAAPAKQSLKEMAFQLVQAAQVSRHLAANPIASRSVHKAHNRVNIGKEWILPILTGPKGGQIRAESTVQYKSTHEMSRGERLMNKFANGYFYQPAGQ